MKSKSRLYKIIFLIILLGLLGVISLRFYGKHQMSKIPDLSFFEALEYTTHNNAEAVITVGIIKDGQVSYKVYGENAVELPKVLHTYEIGSITKTFTATLINKGINEGLINLNDTVDYYLDVPNDQYPTVEELLTHTSGYKSFYFEAPMIANFFQRQNSFYGISKEMILNRVGKVNVAQEENSFHYSNFGYAVLGLIVESVYETDSVTVMNEFIQRDLGLKDTKISDGSGDLNNYWDWHADDGYIPAGAITSNIHDMLTYTKIQMEDKNLCSQCQQELKPITFSSEEYQMMGIRMDSIGMAWIIDEERNVIWHNGGTTNYNSYLGFNPESKTAVVVLSNLPPKDRIPATVLGIKLLDELTK